MIPRYTLDRVIEKETFAEILACLSPRELVAAALRLEGLSDTEIGALLGISRQAVRQRLLKARRRIIHTRPDLAPALRGRHMCNHQVVPTLTPPLAHGWLCEPPSGGDAPCSSGPAPPPRDRPGIEF